MKHLITTLSSIAVTPKCPPSDYNEDHIRELKHRGLIYTDGYGYVKASRDGRALLLRKRPVGKLSHVMVPMYPQPEILAAHGLTQARWKRLLLEVSYE